MARRKTRAKAHQSGHGNGRWQTVRTSLVALGFLLVLGRELKSLRYFASVPGSDSGSIGSSNSSFTISSTAAAVASYLHEQISIPYWKEDANVTVIVDPQQVALPTLDPCHETTIVITTNMIPIAPSIAMINATIHSMHHLKGLCNTSKILIACDNISPNDASNPNISARFHEYIFNHIQTFGWWPHVKIVVQKEHLQLANSLYEALQLVDTEFLYVLQHDMPFLQDVDHTALVKTFREYPNDLKIVRFPIVPNFPRPDEQAAEPGCYNMSTPVNHVNGIHLIKTHKWADHNHFTTTEHYHEVFEAITAFRGCLRCVRAMEWVMVHVATKNCSYYGQFLYGPKGGTPWIGHLNGRQTPDLSKLQLPGVF